METKVSATQRTGWFVKKLAPPRTPQDGPNGANQHRPQVTLAGPFKTLLAAEDAAEQLVASGIEGTLYCECNPIP